MILSQNFGFLKTSQEVQTVPAAQADQTQHIEALNNIVNTIQTQITNLGNTNMVLTKFLSGISSQITAITNEMQTQLNNANNQIASATEEI